MGRPRPRFQALEIQSDWVLDQSFPQTAEGIYLDRHAEMRGLTRLPASKAVGVLRFYVESAPAGELPIPEGTGVHVRRRIPAFKLRRRLCSPRRCCTPHAPAEALEGGADGNVVAGAVNILTACPVAVTGCSNPAAFSGGSDAEDDEALRERILASYRPPAQRRQRRLV